MKLAKFFNHRPLSVLAMLLCIRGIVYGIGYASSDPFYTRGRLWNILLDMSIEPTAFGWGMVTLSSSLMIAFLLQRNRCIRILTWANIFAYMFIGMEHVVGMEYIQAYTQGVVWALSIAFISYTYLNYDILIESDTVSLE